MKIELLTVKLDTPGTIPEESYHFYITEFSRKDRKKVATWINENCDGGTLMWGRGPYERYMKFYDDNDATLFKLSWL